ncbi:MAG: hypothetical protein KME32_33885 [Mojavia pulchra JT2-VF2]|jgi:hypothetical protein|uniref:Uncharacterized protein n=1 Tax=Mojavia pulchra JT2-VF2 TaxID=287848 RepID=A0A951UJK7_9NOST|nr:hypothetical protein [Mojavia pulchra JT2-VF2]
MATDLNTTINPEQNKSQTSRQPRQTTTVSTPTNTEKSKVTEFQKQDALSVLFGLLPIPYKTERWKWCSESFLDCQDGTADHRRPDFEFWLENDKRRALGECKLGELTGSVFRDVMLKRYVQLAESQTGRKYELWFICDRCSPGMKAVLEGVSILHGAPIKALTYSELANEVLQDLKNWVLSTKQITPKHYRTIQSCINERCKILF